MRGYTNRLLSWQLDFQMKLFYRLCGISDTEEATTDIIYRYTHDSNSFILPLPPSSSLYTDQLPYLISKLWTAALLASTDQPPLHVRLQGSNTFA